MEVVGRGSVQCHPSTEDFDSGVDDLQSPHHYIVWNMNMNTHIFPEYVFSFKMVSSADCGMYSPFSFSLDEKHIIVAVHQYFSNNFDGTRSIWLNMHIFCTESIDITHFSFASVYFVILNSFEY